MIMHLSATTSASVDDRNGMLTIGRTFPTANGRKITLTRSERIRLREFLDMLDAKTA